MKILKYSDVTPHNLYLNRRKFVEALGLTSLAFVATPTTAKQNYSTSAQPNTIDEITNYNNFYEFGTSKTDPAKYAQSLTTDPWEITFEGVSQNKKKFNLVELGPGDGSMAESWYCYRYLISIDGVPCGCIDIALMEVPCPP